MKLLYVMDGRCVYGAEVLIRGLVEARVRAREEPILGSNGIREDPLEPGKSVEAEAATQSFRAERFRFLPGPNLLGAPGIRRFARRARTAVLHVHGYKGNTFLGLVPHRMWSAPIVSTVRRWTGIGHCSQLAHYECLDAHLRVRERYSMDRCAWDYNALYWSVIAARGAAKE